MTDPAFQADRAGLQQALDLLVTGAQPGAAGPAPTAATALPARLPEHGLGEAATLDRLAPLVLGGASRLDSALACAHMDPPTPWITWATTLWNASLNQNLLHPDLSPAARAIEARVIDWLAPLFGMDGGHMTAGSTLANLTGLWAAREVKGVRRVVSSTAAHNSIQKAAHLLGLRYDRLPTDAAGRLRANTLPDDLSDAVLVLIAGTTHTGAIDPLALAGRAAWTHVDAAWAGPLRLSPTHAHRLDGIEGADSIAISAHKWLFQPKESALILFRDAATAHPAISFGAAYLTVPTIGVLGSRAAVAVPLLATLLAWGRTGMAARIDRTLALAEALWQRLSAHPQAELFGPPEAGIVLWRPKGTTDVRPLRERLPPGSTSVTEIDGRAWLRHVAANPCADLEVLWAGLAPVLDATGRA